MIIYHPAFDIYNCAFRLLQIMELMHLKQIEIDRLRVWDFYFVFPKQVKGISFPSSITQLRKKFNVLPNPYEDIVDAKQVFERMKPFQYAALKYLASYGLVDASELVDNICKRTGKSIPNELQYRLTDITSEQQNVFELFSSGFINMPLYGKLGFKERTKLLDFKYDPV